MSEDIELDKHFFQDSPIKDSGRGENMAHERCTSAAPTALLSHSRSLTDVAEQRVQGFSMLLLK